MLPLIHIHGAIRVEYRVRTRALGQNLGAIESETQRIGGSGGVCALALSQLGARVHLSGNALGDDSHGRFLQKQLELEGINGEFSLHKELSTPYAILLRNESGETQTLLSPSALNLEWSPSKRAEEGLCVLDFSLGNRNGSYGELLDDLRAALLWWLDWSDLGGSAESWMANYDASFGDFALEYGKEKRGSS